MANAAATLLAGRPEAVALIEPGQQITYAELRGRVMNMAAAWRAQGLTPGDTGSVGLAFNFRAGGKRGGAVEPGICSITCAPLVARAEAATPAIGLCDGSTHNARRVIW